MDRAKIADVLIKAQEKAEMILQEAKEKADEERRKLLNLPSRKRKNLWI